MPHPCEHLLFRVSQKVIEQYGDDQATAKRCEAEIVSVDGRTCMTDLGGEYDRLTGAAAPKGSVYRSIRSMTVDDAKKRAENLLGGVEKGRP